MPTANGNHYRSFGQAYAAEKGKAPEAQSEEQGDKGDTMVIKHLGGGRFKSKHKGQMQEHETPEDLSQHVKQAYGLEDENPEPEHESDSDSEDEGGLHSILG
jgi:hypothetical protein